MSDGRNFDDEARLDRTIWLDGLPVVKNNIEGNASYILNEWRVRVDNEGRMIRTLHLPAFTDYDSVPKAVRFFLPRTFASDNVSRLSALVHDLGYKWQVCEYKGVLIPITREQMDTWFHELHINLIMAQYKGKFNQWVHIQRARIMTQMVRWFGQSTWDEYAKQNKAKEMGK